MKSPLYMELFIIHSKMWQEFDGIHFNYNEELFIPPWLYLQDLVTLLND